MRTFQSKLFFTAVSAAVIALAVAGVLFAITIRHQMDERIENTLVAEARFFSSSGQYSISDGTHTKMLFADIMSAWDTTCCGTKPGGIWWRTQHDSKVTAINAGAVVSASRLYERTKDAQYLSFAQKVEQCDTRVIERDGSRDAVEGESD